MQFHDLLSVEISFLLMASFNVKSFFVATYCRLLDFKSSGDIQRKRMERQLFRIINPLQ